MRSHSIRYCDTDMKKRYIVNCMLINTQGFLNKTCLMLIKWAWEWATKKTVFSFAVEYIYDTLKCYIEPHCLQLLSGPASSSNSRIVVVPNVYFIQYFCRTLQLVLDDRLKGLGRSRHKMSENVILFILTTPFIIGW